jgi:hypothetical protein
MLVFSEIAAKRRDNGARSEQVEILRAIWKETKGLNQRVDGTNERLEGMRDELGRGIVDSEMRTAIALANLAGAIREIIGILRASSDLRPRVEKCEQDIAPSRVTTLAFIDAVVHPTRRSHGHRVPRPETFGHLVRLFVLGGGLP